MLPATYNIITAANATYTQTFTRSGVTTAVGWGAAIDIREEESSTSTLLLALTSLSGGIALTSNGSVLSIAVTITETQIDTLHAALTAAGKTQAFYSLKLTKPDLTTEQLLIGTFSLKGTPTA